MDVRIFNMYLEGMQQIQCEEDLKEFTYSMYPKLTADARKSLHRNTYKRAYPNEFNNPKNVVKLSDLSKALK